MRQVTVTGQIVSKNGITLFFADGGSEVLSNESFRTKEILERIMPDMISKGRATVDLDSNDFQVTLEKLGVKTETTQNGTAIVTAGGKLEGAGEALEKHIHHAMMTGDAKGLKNFLDDLTPVIAKRKHSVDDLLAFMKKADLPIADDGSLLVYKVLRTKSGQEGQEGWFVDCHTGKVQQRVGSTVQVKDESMVDPNRAQECSNGLHVCQIGYVRSFGGDVICLAKVRPSDVIAVPTHDINKMRVSRYTLVSAIPAEMHEIVRNGTSAVVDPKLRDLVSKVMGGEHAAVNSIITINGQHGQNVTVELLETPPTPAATKRIVETMAKNRVQKDRQLDKFAKKSAPVDVKQVKAEVTARRGKLTPAEKKRKEYEKKLAKAQRLFDRGKSIREISEELGMDRKSLSANLVRG